MTIAIRQIRILDGLGHRLEQGTLVIEGDLSSRSARTVTSVSLKVPNGSMVED